MALALLLAALSSSAAQPPWPADIRWQVPCRAAPWPSAPAVRPFPERERLELAVSWGVLSAGRGSLEVSGLEPVEGRPAYRLAMELRAAGLAAALHRFSDRTESWLDAASLTTVRTRKRTREKGFERDEAAVVDQACRRFYRREDRVDKRTTAAVQGRLPGPAHDLVGTIYHMRALALKEGARYRLSLLSGGKVWPVTFVVRRRERVAVPGGRFDCWFLEPEAVESGAKFERLALWLTADERKLPVRLRLKAPVGHFVAELAAPPVIH